MSLTVIVATTGRTTLADAVRTTAGRLPVERFLIVPAERPIDPEVAARADVQVLAPVAGLFAAWNAAVAEVTTSHAMFVNDDDRLDGPPLASDVLDADRPVNLPFRRAGGPVRRSVSVSIGSAIVRSVDLLHANRAGNINSFLWPRSVLDRVGRFVTTYRSCGDIEWLLRFVALEVPVRWLDTPTYVQGRGPERLSAWVGNGPAIAEERTRFAGVVTAELGPRSATSLLFGAWAAAHRLRAARDAVIGRSGRGRGTGDDHGAGEGQSRTTSLR